MKNGILRQIAEIESLSLPELRERWRELFGTEAPGYSASHLKRRLAYRVQELAFGGVGEVTRAKLRAHIDNDESGAVRLKQRKQRDGLPVIGTRLIRIWHDQRHEVTVVSDGCEYQGRRFKSLSAIAKVITGSHWNGRAFFGLRKPKPKGKP